MAESQSPFAAATGAAAAIVLAMTRLFATLIFITIALMGCASLPPRSADLVPVSQAIAPGTDTPLARIAQAALAEQVVSATPKTSAFKLMPLAASAYATRIELIAQATRSIDLQTFVFNGDDSGAHLLKALRDAALRGVRVRLLIDDLHTDGAQALLSDLAAFEQVQVRLVNPFVRLRGSRGAKLLSSLDELSRVNHRMHNKVFVADNALAVFGGRNVGDEYFMRAREGGNFIDIDVLAAGQVVADLSASFDRYWNSEFAWPIDAVVPPRASPSARQQSFTQRVAALAAPAPDVGVPARLAAFASAPAELRAGRLSLVHADSEVSVDPVDKLGRTRVNDRAGTVRASVGALMGEAGIEVFVVSPYFIPGEIGMAAILRNRERGVRLRLLTNSLAATDEPAVHAGYIAYRHEMLRAGVEIFELSPAWSREQQRLGRFGSTAGVLHAKVIVIDQARLFVGSMNLDGRSERYNTEIGVLIHSAALAQQFVSLMDFESSAYRLRLGADDSLQWWHQADGRETMLAHEPEVGWLRKLGSRVLGALLPHDWL
jgi:cardiolipin synthase C